MPPRGGTAWTSDRIRPPTHKPTPQTPSKSDKGKGHPSTPDPPRSAAVRKLDELLAGLRSTSPKRPTQDGCFCQARTHQPSEYTPLCTTCGLILCTLQAPHYPCPHCSSPLLDASARAALLVLLDEQRADVLAEEAAERTRAAEALRRAEGAFPALGGTPGGGGGKAAAGVLSFDRQTKRVRVEAYRVREDVEVIGGGNGEDKSGSGSGRVPPPVSLREVQYLRVPRGPATRWAVSMGGSGGAKYVAA